MAATMTEPAPPRERIKPPGPFMVIAGSLGLFLALLSLLAFQLRTGRDPALGKGSQTVASTAAAPRRGRMRPRLIITRVVTHVRRDDATPAREAAPAPRSAPATAAPAQAAPAPAAPAPAPLTTRSS
jgi:hypothetical protein